jgi:hypothetical protein
MRPVPEVTPSRGCSRSRTISPLPLTNGVPGIRCTENGNVPACGWIGASPGVQHPGVTPSFDMRSPIPTASWTRRLSSHLTRPYTPATPGIPPKFEWLTRLNAVTASAIFPCSCPRDATVMAIASLMGVGVSGVNSRIRTASVGGGGVGVAVGGVGGVGLLGLLVPPPHAVTHAIMTSNQNVSGERWIAIGRQSTGHVAYRANVALVAS